MGFVVGKVPRELDKISRHVHLLLVLGYRGLNSGWSLGKLLRGARHPDAFIFSRDPFCSLATTPSLSGARLL